MDWTESSPGTSGTTRRLVHPVTALAAVAAIALVARAQGCGRRQASYDRYVPEETAAHQALEAVLSAWKRDGIAEEVVIELPEMTVKLVDTRQRDGDRLLDFEIRGEISGEGPRTFEVLQRMESSAADQRVLYYLVGIDPVWVFRQEDYDMVVHWDHAMEDPGTAEDAGAPPASTPVRPGAEKPLESPSAQPPSDPTNPDNQPSE